MKRAQAVLGIEPEGDAKTVTSIVRMAEPITECAKTIQVEDVRKEKSARTTSNTEDRDR